MEVLSLLADLFLTFIWGGGGRPLNEIILVNIEQNYHNLHKFSCTHIKIVDQFSRGNINENKTETNTILNLVSIKKKKKKNSKSACLLSGNNWIQII